MLSVKAPLGTHACCTFEQSPPWTYFIEASLLRYRQHRNFAQLYDDLTFVYELEVVQLDAVSVVLLHVAVLCGLVVAAFVLVTARIGASFV